jgi:hypothetical protein
MPGTVAILDDEPDRLQAMIETLSRRFPHVQRAIFDNAPDMIEWCREHLGQCLLICLDHDLGPNRVRDGGPFDPGTGRDVADYLATREPTCPVIVHTTNSLAAPGMELALKDAGWRCSRVVPYNGPTWISDWWIEEVARVLASA